MILDREVLAGLKCPYCGKKTELTDSAEVYGGRSYGSIYICRPCDAYVGCHKDTTEAKGRLADAELRKWKKKAHEAFDPIWKERYMSRKEAYAWLSTVLDIPSEFTHIGMFDIDECMKVMSESVWFLLKHKQ